MGKFVKGVSGNPGGRPGGIAEIRDIAKEHTPAAIECLVRIMNAQNASQGAQVQAAIALLDRGWGKPEQSVRASVNDSFGDALEQILARRQAVSIPELAS
jgi:hypothetical protein